jgi:hypothetical protein
MALDPIRITAEGDYSITYQQIQSVATDVTRALVAGGTFTPEA